MSYQIQILAWLFVYMALGLIGRWVINKAGKGR